MHSLLRELVDAFEVAATASLVAFIVDVATLVLVVSFEVTWSEVVVFVSLVLFIVEVATLVRKLMALELVLLEAKDDTSPLLLGLFVVTLELLLLPETEELARSETVVLEEKLRLLREEGVEVDEGPG